jgi:hypothetical protein
MPEDGLKGQRIHGGLMHLVGTGDLMLCCCKSCLGSLQLLVSNESCSLGLLLLLLLL